MKKFIATLALLALFLIGTDNGSFFLVETTTDFVQTKVGPVPIEYTLGDIIYPDNFYKDFTK